MRLANCLFLAVTAVICVSCYNLSLGERADAGIASGDTDAGWEPENGSDADSDADAGMDSGSNDAGDDADSGQPSCEGVICHTPPENVCDADDALEVFDPSGYCVDGGCRYVAGSEECEKGTCSDGKCSGDFCQGVFCAQPPGNECVNGSSIRVYDTMGYCKVGTCVYDYIEIECASGVCTDDACSDDVCEGVSCIRSPARYCSGATNVRVFDAFGSCMEDGSCNFGFHDVDCQGPCIDGFCENDPCREVVCRMPPAPACIDGSTLRVYGADGFCRDMVCKYGWQDIHCDKGCSEGHCTDDTCAGMTCETPPASKCLPDGKLVVYSSTGTCSDGRCEYFSSELPCTGGCENGRCRGDPCEGVICSTPPAAHCNGDYRVWYDGIGTCREGSCMYEEKRKKCENGCMDGECL